MTQTTLDAILDRLTNALVPVDWFAGNGESHKEYLEKFNYVRKQLGDMADEIHRRAIES